MTKTTASQVASMVRERAARGQATHLTQTVDVAPEAKATTPKATHRQGTRVRVTGGDVPQMRKDDACVGERSAAGMEAVVDGGAYVAVGGPNKGKTMQQVREVATGSVFAVPAERIAGPGEHSRARVGYSPAYAAAYERAFGSKPKPKSDESWVEVAPGRRVLRPVKEHA